MKPLVTLLLVLSAATIQPKALSAASAKASLAWKQAPLAIACMRLGALTFLVLPPTADRLDGREAEVIVLAGPTRPASEIKSYRDGSSVFFGSSADGAPFTRLGHSAYQKMQFLGKPAELNSFQQDGEPWACVIDEILYQELDGVAKAIATTALRSYKAEDGKERRAQMCQRSGEHATWCFAGDNGKVYLQDQTGKVIQIGWMGWRIATLSNGEKPMILMTKGMGDAARWSGKHGGKLLVGE
jgi:hypothetical protein